MCGVHVEVYKSALNCVWSILSKNKFKHNISRNFSSALNCIYAACVQEISSNVMFGKFWTFG